MGDFFGFERNDPYETRKAIVSDKGIAVWDVLASCQRQGSLDKDIKFPEVNDIGAFVKSHPSLRAIVFNGGKARQVFLQTYQDKIEGIDLIALGSTSPAYTLAYEKKRDQWRIILDYLDHE
jgi:TDG/mug DNA glycosylase family protein